MNVKSTCIAAAFLVAIASGAARAQDVRERVIKFGHLNNTDHPVSMGVHKFAELVAAKSGGKMQVKEFPSNQLGTEQQQTSAVQGGVQEMQSPATTSIVGIVKDFGVIDFPFTVSNHAQAFALLDGPLGKALLDKLPEKGLVGLAYWDLGFRNVTNSKRPINRPDDLDGLKLRVIPNPVFIDTFKANPELRAKGMQFNDMTAAERDRLRAIAKPVTDKALATYDPAIQKVYTAEVERVQKLK